MAVHSRVTGTSQTTCTATPAASRAATSAGEAPLSAKLAHEALGCRHYSLFDFRIDPAGRPWLLEAGLYCSFARSSVIATMAAAAGIGVPELFATAVDQALGATTPRA